MLQDSVDIPDTVQGPDRPSSQTIPAVSRFCELSVDILNADYSSSSAIGPSDVSTASQKQSQQPEDNSLPLENRKPSLAEGQTPRSLVETVHSGTWKELAQVLHCLLFP